MTNSNDNNPFPQTVDSLILHVNIVTFSKDYGFNASAQSRAKHDNPHAYGQLQDAAIAVKVGKIVWIGESASAQVNASNHVTDGKGQWVTPGLIDCHTHLVYAGNRSNEFEARLQGMSYKEIAENGGGIVATVSATREASFDALYQQSEKRLQALLVEGLTTVEIKSGYGLDLESERKMLQVARKLGENYPVTVKTTYLAAHALPPEYKQRADDYIDAVCEWMLILHEEGLIDAVDGFCENIGFSKAQMAKVFETAKSLGLPVKLHAEQLTNMDGSALVAEYHGLSSDHLEYLSLKNVKELANSGSVAVLLPGAFYTLKEKQLPPIDALNDHHVPIALATDCNPGTSPLTSLLLTLNMGCTLFGLTPEQALAALTTHAAKALGLESKGRIEIGCDADLVLWDIARPADLAYLIGFNPLTRVMVNGHWR